MNNSHRFENLTWPEVNEAVEKGLIPILPVGTVEQHGPHLPIKMDLWTADSVANEAASGDPTGCWRCRSSRTASPPT